MTRDHKARLALALGIALILGALSAATPGLAGHHPWDQGHDPFAGQPPDDPDPPEDDPDCNDSGSPFTAATGNYFYSYADLFATSLGPEIRLARTYNSQDRRNGPLGQGWTHTYDVRLLDLTDGVTVSAVCRKGTGKRFRFQRHPDGSYSPPPDFFAELTQLPDGTFSLEEPDGTTKLFDTDGLLTAIQDLDGNQISLTYDATGFLISVANASGGQVDLTKGPDGKIATITDTLGGVFQYDYDVDGRLIAVTDSSTETTTFVYGVDGRLAQILDSLGRIVQDLSYDSEGRVTAYVENGVSWTVAYTPAENKTTKTNPLGDIWTMLYNDNGNVVERLNPLGGSRTTVYDENGRPIQITNEVGAVTTYEYDSRGNIITLTDPLGNSTSWEYEPASDLLLRITDRGGNTTEYTYDNGRVVRVEDGLGVLETLEYTPGGQVSKSTDANGNETSFIYNTEGLLENFTASDGGETALEYDAAGNRTAVVDPDGLRMEWVYDAKNRVIIERDPLGYETTTTYVPECSHCSGNALVASRTDATGRTTEWRYDRFGRPVETVFPDGTSVETAYDAAGNVATVTDRAGKVTSFTNDALGRMTAQQRPGSGALTLSYDAASRVTSTTDGGGLTTSFAFDAADHVTSIANSDAGTRTRSYAANGLLRTLTDARGVTETRDYDLRGRVTGQSYPTPDENIAYGWNEAASQNGSGRLTSVDDPSGSTRFHYDVNSRPIRVAATISGVVYDLVYTYSPAGRVESTVYPSGLVVTYARDGAGRIQTVELADGGQMLTLVGSVSYDDDGRLTGFTYGNGLQATQAYDAAGALQSTQVATVDHVIFNRDAASNLVGIADQLSPSRSRSFAYDDAYRLVSATSPPGVLSYSYDAAGNRVSHTDSTGTASYSYIGNRLTSIGGSVNRSYAYDAAGNVTSNGAGNFTYSSSGRMMAVASGGVETARYSYNFKQQLVLKETSAGTVVFHYDQRGRLIEVSDDVGTVLMSYFYLHGWAPVARRLASGDLEFFVSDHLGTPKALTDQVGAEIWRGEFYPFGKLHSETGGPTPVFRFLGQIWDPEAGLSYNWHRWYEAETGRYGRVDPVLERYAFSVRGDQPYAYVGSNPVNYVDKLGLYGTNDCTYYERRCRESGGKYYCETAPKYCEKFPDRPDPNPDCDDDYEGWYRCTRKCLQDCDDENRPPPDPCPQFPDPRTEQFDQHYECHRTCYLICFFFRVPPYPAGGTSCSGGSSSG